MTNIIGLDLGMGGVKTWSHDGGHILLSQVSAPTAQSINFNALGLKPGKRPMAILNGTGRYFVGQGAHDAGEPIERLDYDRLTGSPEMRALVYGALSNHNTVSAATPTLDLFVGLPLGLAAGEGSRERVAAVKAWLGGDHHWHAGKHQHVATIASVGCVSQAHAAYADWLLELDGRPRNKAPKGAEVGVISIGFNTIEMLVLRDMQPIEKFTSGEKLGVRRLLELINEQRGGLYSLGELDVQLRAGHLDEPAALAKWQSQVLGHIERVWGDEQRRFALVLAVGGGCVLLRSALQRLFGARLGESDEPVMSVARGLFKLGVRQAGAGK